MNYFVSRDLRDTFSSDNKDVTFCKTLISLEYEFEKHTIRVYLNVTDKEYA